MVRTLRWPISEEWNFSQLEASEIETCRDFEMGREVVRQERIYREQRATERTKLLSDTEWLETRVAAIRRAWQLTGFTSCIREQPSWFLFPASRVLVLYPEWPEMPYLKIDQNERLRRLQELLDRATNNAPLSNLEHLLEPSNTATGAKSIREIAIPECLTHGDLILAFNAWLQINFPKQGKRGRKKDGQSEYSRRQGRGSDKATMPDDLNAIAAHRL
jgi:hypothetical protein